MEGSTYKNDPLNDSQPEEYKDVVDDKNTSLPDPSHYRNSTFDTEYGPEKYTETLLNNGFKLSRRLGRYSFNFAKGTFSDFFFRGNFGEVWLAKVMKEADTLRIREGLELERQKRIANSIRCENCKQKVTIPWFHCTVCPDFDLCSPCRKKAKHPESHKFQGNLSIIKYFLILQNRNGSSQN